MRATCWFRSVTMRTLVVVGRLASPTSDGAMPASRHAWASVARRVVHAGDGDERRLSAERRDVVRHVGRAAHPQHLVIEGDDRHRRLGRDARDAADDELVEHGVADDEDAGAAGRRRDPARAVRRDGWQQHGPVDRRKRQRDEHEEQHQEFGVAEVVLEQAGGEHRGDRRQRRGRRARGR